MVMRAPMARQLTFVFSALLAGQLATSSCAGPEFSPDGDCDDDGCEAGSAAIEEQAGRGGSGAGADGAGAGGASGGGKGGTAGRGGAAGSSSGRGGTGQSSAGTGGIGAEGGDGAGGLGGFGGSAGTPPAGGSAGAGMGGVAAFAGTQVGGAAGAEPVVFPRTDVLDDFEEPEDFAGQWFGNLEDFTVANGVLTCFNCPHAALHSDKLGADQEAYVTLAGFESSADEINLILLAQNEICELIEVLYSPVRQVLEVHTCYFGVWEAHGSTAATLAAGDRFGARLHSDGTVQVYVNGEERLSAALGALENDDGYIGLSGNTSEPIVFDVFGGGEWR